MFTAVVLLVATLTLLASALPSVRLGSGRAGASISLAGSAMLVGVIWAVTVYNSYLIESADEASGDPGGLEIDLFFGAGFWLLVAGLVLAVVATVLAKLPIRATTPPYPPMLDGPTRPLVPHTSPPLFGATP